MHMHKPKSALNHLTSTTTPAPRSIGLLPLFNEASGYLKHKSSSSVAASLATGAPLVVPAAFLETYSYIKREHVLLMVRTRGAR